MRHVWVVIGALALGLAFAAPAAAQTATQDQAAKSLVVLSGDATVPARATVDTVVAFDGAVVVNGHVTGTVVAFNGPVMIDGTVTGDVVATNGTLRLGPDARVGGSVYADHRVIDPNAAVTGTINSLSSFGSLSTALAVVAGFAVWLAVAISVLVLGLLLLWLAPGVSDAAVAAGRTAVGPAIGWGLAIVVGLPIIAVVSMATLVGFPLGIGVLLALFLIFAIGQTTGVWVFGRTLIRTGSRAKAFLAGWAIVSAVTLIPFAGGLIWIASTVFGLGALTVAGYRMRRAAMPPSVVPAAPAAA